MNKFSKLFALMFLVSSIGLVAMDEAIGSDSDDEGVTGVLTTLENNSSKFQGKPTRLPGFGKKKDKQQQQQQQQQEKGGSTEDDSSSPDISESKSTDDVPSLISESKSAEDVSTQTSEHKSAKKPGKIAQLLSPKSPKHAEPKQDSSETQQLMLDATKTIATLEKEKAVLIQRVQAHEQQLQSRANELEGKETAIANLKNDIAAKEEQIKSLQRSLTRAGEKASADSKISSILGKLYPTTIFDLTHLAPDSYELSFKKLVNYGTLPVTVAVILGCLYKLYQKSKVTAPVEQTDVDSQAGAQTDDQGSPVAQDNQAGQDISAAQVTETAQVEQTSEVVVTEQVVQTDQTVQTVDEQATPVAQAAEASQAVENVVTQDQANQAEALQA